MRNLRPVALIVVSLLVALSLSVSREVAARQPADDLFEHARDLALEQDSAVARFNALQTVAVGAAGAGREELATLYFEMAAEQAERSERPTALLRRLATAAARSNLGPAAGAVAERHLEAADRAQTLLAAAEAAASEGHHQLAEQLLSRAVEATGQVDEPLRRTERLAGAAAANLSLGRRSEAERLLEQALSTAQELDEVDIPQALFAPVAAGLGRSGEALEFARAVEPARERVGTLLECVRISLESAGGRGAQGYGQAVLSAGEQMETTEWVHLLGRSIREWRHLAEEPAVRELLEGAAERAGDHARQTGRPSLLTFMASVYGDLGHWESAARWADRADDPYSECRYRARAILEAAGRDGGQTLERDLRRLPGEYVQFLGRQMARQMAEAYWRVRPDASRRRIGRLGPDELTDIVYQTFAVKAAAEGNYSRSSQLVGAISFPELHEEGLRESALAALETAPSRPEAISFVSERLEEVRTNISRLELLFPLGMALLAEGNREGAAEIADRLRELGRTWNWEEGETMSLVDRAIILSALGREEEALAAARSGMRVYSSISCPSCRDSVLQHIFNNFRSHHTPEMLRVVVEGIEFPHFALEYALLGAEELPDLSHSDGNYLLERALEAALRQGDPVRIDSVLEVADAYVRAGWELGADALALLTSPPEQFSYEPDPVRPPARPQEADADLSSLVFFTQTGCEDCEKVSRMLQRLEQEDENLRLVTIDLRGEQELNAALARALNTRAGIVPAVFSSERALLAHEITEDSLKGLVAESRGLPDPITAHVSAATLQAAREDLGRSYEEFATLGVAVLSGLVDSFNPCAFTVIIFFVTYMAYIGKSRRETAWAGGIFTGAVFVTYFLAGIVMWSMVQTAHALFSSVLVTILYGAIALLVLAAAMLSFRDAVYSMKGRPEKMMLVLPDTLKGKVRRMISARARFGLTAGAMAGLGAVVALIELPCTGQTYLPTIMWALNYMEGELWRPLRWLLVYNLTFITPLVVIFVAVLFGLSSDRLTSWFRGHVAAVKFALGGMFTLLFFLLAHQVLRTL